MSYNWTMRKTDRVIHGKIKHNTVQGSLQLPLREDIVESDAKLIDDSFNRGPVRWLIDWNFPGAAYPEVSRVLEREPDLAAMAARDEKLHRMGYRRKKEDVEKAYGIEVEDVGATPPQAAEPEPPAAADFADPENVEDALDAILNGISDSELGRMSERLMRPLIDAAEHDPQGVFETIAERYPAMDESELREKLERVMFVVEVWGRLNARSG